MKILSGLLAFAVAQQVAVDPVEDQDDQNAVDEAAAEEPSAIELAIADVDFGEFAGMEDLMVDLFETVFDPEVMKELKKDGKDKPGKPGKGKGKGDKGKGKPGKGKDKDKKKGDKPKVKEKATKARVNPVKAKTRTRKRAKNQRKERRSVSQRRARNQRKAKYIFIKIAPNQFNQSTALIQISRNQRKAKYIFIKI